MLTASSAAVPGYESARTDDKTVTVVLAEVSGQDTVMKLNRRSVKVYNRVIYVRA